MSLLNIINELTVSNVTKSMEFYKNYFSFNIELTDGEPIIWARLSNNGKVLMLEDYNEAKKEIVNFPKKTNSSNLIMFEYSNVDEMKDIYRKLKDNGVEFFSDYTEMDYGKAEFGVYDLDKNMILVSAEL